MGSKFEIHFAFAILVAVLVAVPLILVYKKVNAVLLVNHSNDAIVTAMEDCIGIHGSSVQNDNELNRLYKQCWNHAQLKKGKSNGK